MAECIQCESFTKYNGGLCSTCYSKKNQMNKSFTRDEDCKERPVGLTDKDYHYRYNMIKGRIAETLIQELFLSLDYNVFRFGMENTIPGIVELLRGVRSDVAQEIRRMPDFVIQNPKTKDVHFVEVKFRASGEYTINDLPKDYPYTNAYIILVSKKHIKCLSVEELETGETISPSSKNYLGNRKEFELNKDVIVQFCDFALQFFEKV